MLLIVIILKQHIVKEACTMIRGIYILGHNADIKFDTNIRYK